jgi:AFG3 family protein
MSINKGDKQPGKIPGKPGDKKKFNPYWLYGLILVGILGLQFLNFDSMEKSNQQKFAEMLRDHDVEKIVIVNNNTVEVSIEESSLDKDQYKDVRDRKFGGGKNTGPHYYFEIGSDERFGKFLDGIQKDVPETEKIVPEYTTRADWTGQILSWVIPIGILILIWVFIMRRMSGGMGGAGGQIFNVGKSKASLYDKNTQVNVTFKDVAGLEEAKEEIMEIVDFLKSPDKYTSLGGKIPKGALLVGPPGTGKTLIAKAMAGEAQVPFFSISGSDFVEMFVGVGASRVRDLFKQAREKAPCIIFIDEIDAIGRARGKSMMQGNDERESTLNQLLVEMDGFSSDKGVIIVAATNRPDVLDSALLRAGRFDRQIGIEKPDLNSREQIFKVHLKPLKVSKEIDPKRLAEHTPGFVGADIANICNEAALIAARFNKKSIEMKDFQDAIDRNIGGLEKKNKLISPEEKKIIAYHEAGHAICGWFLEHADPLLKVSIVPRGIAALGYAQYLPKEQYLMNTEQFADRMCKTLGGRAAEMIIFNKISTGAQNDLDVVTKIAYSMVTVYGMNEEIGNVSYYDMQNEYGFGKPYSEELAYKIDLQVKKIIDVEFDRAVELLADKKSELESIAVELLKKEVLFKDDLERLIGKRPFDDDNDGEAENKPSDNHTPSSDEKKGSEPGEKENVTNPETQQL